MLSVCDIFAKQEKCRYFELEKEGQGREVEERDLRHSTGNVPFHIGDFFRILAAWEHTFCKFGDTYTHTHTETVVSDD